MAKSVRYGAWIVTLPDEEHLWEPDEMTVAEWMTLETELDQMSFRDWVQAIDDRDAVACQVLVWWLRRQDGQPQERFAVDFKIRQLDLVQVEEDEPDPEAPAPSEGATEFGSSSDGESD